MTSAMTKGVITVCASATTTTSAAAVMPRKMGLCQRAGTRAIGHTSLK